MIATEEIKEWLLKNCVDTNGDLDSFLGIKKEKGQ